MYNKYKYPWISDNYCSAHVYNQEGRGLIVISMALISVLTIVIIVMSVIGPTINTIMYLPPFSEKSILGITKRWYSIQS